MPIASIMAPGPMSGPDPVVPADVSRHIPSYSFVTYLVLQHPPASTVYFLTSVPLFRLCLQADSFFFPSPLPNYIFLVNAYLSSESLVKYHFFSSAFLLSTELVASLVSQNIYFYHSMYITVLYLCVCFSPSSAHPHSKNLPFKKLMVSDFVLTYFASTVFAQHLEHCMHFISV